MNKILYRGVGEKVYYERLANGLDVFLCPSETAKNFYLTLNVKFGSVDTEFKVDKDKKFTVVPNGTAHYLEHQMFQEDDGHTAFEHFAELGSSVNAFTTYEYTSYEVVASDKFKENLEYLLDYVQNPVFKEKSVNKERGIIKEEIKMYDNTPMSVLNFGLEYNLNKVDKHKYLISGTEEDIKAIDAQVLYKCYDTFYTPSNMFMVLTGKFAPLEALGIIKSNQAKKEFAEPKKVVRKQPKEPEEVSKPYETRTMDVSTPKLKIAYKLDKSKFKNYSNLQLKIYFDAIMQLKFGATSDLLESMLEENLILTDMYPAREIRKDYVMISLEMETDYKEQVIDLVRNELKNVKISKEELDRIKKSNKASFILHFNDIISVAEDIESDILSEGRIVEDIMDAYDAMNLKEINDIASKIDISCECIYYIDKLTV